MLLYLYATNVEPPPIKLDPETLRANGGMNGRPNGHARRDLDRRVRDAEEFELEGLISDEEGTTGHKSPVTPRVPEHSRPTS